MTYFCSTYFIIQHSKKGLKNFAGCFAIFRNLFQSNNDLANFINLLQVFTNLNFLFCICEAIFEKKIVALVSRGVDWAGRLRTRPILVWTCLDRPQSTLSKSHRDLFSPHYQRVIETWENKISQNQTQICKWQILHLSRIFAIVLGDVWEPAWNNQINILLNDTPLWCLMPCILKENHHKSAKPWASPHHPCLSFLLMQHSFDKGSTGSNFSAA